MDKAEKTESETSAGMDRFTRNYLIFLGLVVVVILGSWISSWNPRIGEINDLLESDPQLSGYAYQFRVMELNNGVAQISSPRSFEVPVIRYLGVVHPKLRGKPQDDPAIMAAQEELVLHQKRAGQLVQEQSDVGSIRWVLDENWYLERGIPLN